MFYRPVSWRIAAFGQRGQPADEGYPLEQLEREVVSRLLNATSGIRPPPRNSFTFRGIPFSIG